MGANAAVFSLEVKPTASGPFGVGAELVVSKEMGKCLMPVAQVIAVEISPLTRDLLRFRTL